MAEDSEDNVFLIQHFLKNTNIDLDIAFDGEQALQLYKKNTYDLILMDVHMPVMDGLEATKVIREFETQTLRPPTPVISLTAKAMNENIQESLNAGMDEHLSKTYSEKNIT